MNIALWVVQVLLALLYLFTGSMKLLTPLDELMAQMPVPLPGWFVRFIGLAEVLGVLGLILPGLTRIRTGLTPLAAAGLVVIMIGAVVSTLLIAPVSMAVMPLVVGVLAAIVAYTRWRVVPLRGRARTVVETPIERSSLRRAA